MKIKNLHKFLKQKTNELKFLSSQIENKRKTIASLKEQKKDILQKIRLLDKANFQTVLEVQNTYTFIINQNMRLKQIDSQISYHNNELKDLQIKTKECFSEKSGIEKLIHKIQKENSKLEIQNEGKLAHESFIRKYISR